MLDVTPEPVRTASQKAVLARTHRDHPMTECSKCGDCCERIPIRLSRGEVTARLANPYCAGETRSTLQFIVNHWTLLAVKYERPRGAGDDAWVARGGWYSCDAFDAETRLCTAHSRRPPVCSGYPWYDSHHRPDCREQGNWLSPRCSFRADIPKGSLGALLPIVGVS